MCITCEPGVPSEIIEPAIVATFSMCLRELMESKREPADFDRLVTQAHVLMRLGICCNGTRFGNHVSLATGNLYRRACHLRDMDPDGREEVLQVMAEMSKGGANHE